MSCIFWNCQGLGSTLTVQVLGAMLRKYRPQVIFLSETRGPSHCIEKLKQQWNLYGVGVSIIGLSGGLAMLWSKSVEVVLLSYSNNHIDTRVKMEEGQPWLRITGIYVVPEVNQRQRTCDLMSRLKEESTLPWFLGGDFNEILQVGEKLGGGTRAPRQMMNFNLAISDCGLTDWGMRDFLSRGRMDGSIRTRLDIDWIRCALTRKLFRVFLCPCSAPRPARVEPHTLATAAGASQLSDESEEK